MYCVRYPLQGRLQCAGEGVDEWRGGGVGGGEVGGGRDGAGRGGARMVGVGSEGLEEWKGGEW